MCDDAKRAKVSIRQNRNAVNSGRRERERAHTFRCAAAAAAGRVAAWLVLRRRRARASSWCQTRFGALMRRRPFCSRARRRLAFKNSARHSLRRTQNTHKTNHSTPVHFLAIVCACRFDGAGGGRPVWGPISSRAVVARPSRVLRSAEPTVARARLPHNFHKVPRTARSGERDAL